MAIFFASNSKRKKKLQKVFSWFTILSLVLQIGSGVVLARPALAEETPPEIPGEEVVVQEEGTSGEEETGEMSDQEEGSGETAEGSGEENSGEGGETGEAQEKGNGDEVLVDPVVDPPADPEIPEPSPTPTSELEDPGEEEETSDPVGFGELATQEVSPNVAPNSCPDPNGNSGNGSECQEPDCHKIENQDPGPVSWTAPEGCFVDLVKIKTGLCGLSGELGNGTYGVGACECWQQETLFPCYEVSGVGTQTATVERIGTESPFCQAISHVQFWHSCPGPTPTPEPYCGDGNVDPGEECDDGNNVDGDGCSSTCVLEFCGDGVLQPGLGEECDDGNNDDGDGCSASCEIEEICEEGPTWAYAVESFAQGLRKDGTPVLPERSDPNNALGVPDSPQPQINFVSLGVGGSITLSFQGWILDVAGNDLSFHETTWGRASYPVEKASVEVSQDGTNWLGSWEVTNKDGGDGIGYVDFNSTGLPWIRYVRITDTTDYGPLPGNADGYDLDAVDAFYQVCEEPEPECVEGVLWMIGDEEASQMDNPVDELNWPGMFGVFPAFPDPFTVGTNSDSEFPWNSNYNKGYATDFDVNFNYLGADAAVAQLTISWSPGRSANEQKEVLLDSVSLGTTPVRLGTPVAGWWEQMKRFEDTFTFPLTHGSHTFTFKHLMGDGTLWDYVKLEIISCEEPEPICGDGHVDPGEQCDDGNNVDGDGCSSLCLLEFCGDGILQPGLGEQCDDGNNVDGDGCSAECEIEPRQIRACKYDDYNGNGELDGGEPGIEGVTMTLEKWTLVGEWPFDWLLDGLGEPDFIGWEWQEVATGDTGENGCYTFGDLLPGRYRVSEDLGDLPGYTPTSETSYEVLVGCCGQIHLVNFFNQLVPAEIALELTKENSVSGSTVTYTLEVTNTSDATAYDVHVKDQLPSGFSYNAGTTEIDGSPAGDPSISGQELTWSLGDLDPDQTVVVTYEVTIGDLPDGVYPNIAIAWGWGRGGNITFSDAAFSNFAHSGVGISHGVSTSIQIGGLVLGVSKEVPEVLGAVTGSETYWLILALIMILTGITIRLLDKKRKAWLVKRITRISEKLSIFAVIALLFLVTAGTVWAIDSLFIQVAQLPEYKRTDNFKLYYTALEQQGKPITVDCYVRKDGGFGWKTFGGTQTDPSGFCEVFGHELEGDATYTFKAIATSADGSTESNETSTTVDRVAPNPPGDCRKSRESSTAYRIHWRNPGETDYGWTRIFASQEQNFLADDATKKADIGGGPDEEFDHVVGGLESDKEYFFALQGFDKAGNGSGLCGDGGSVTYVEEEVIGEGIGGGTMDWEELGLLPEEEVEEEEEAPGEILGGITEEAVTPAGLVARVASAVSRANWAVKGLGLLILAGIAYYLYRRFSSE